MDILSSYKIYLKITRSLHYFCTYVYSPSKPIKKQLISIYKAISFKSSSKTHNETGFVNSSLLTQNTLRYQGN